MQFVVMLEGKPGPISGGRIAFDTGIGTDAIMETSQDLGGIHVMTIHRAKGSNSMAL